MTAESVEKSDGPLPPLPQIRRLKIPLFGGDSCVTGVGKTDVASVLLRGLTTDQPGTADPLLDLAFDHGVFEQAWLKLLNEPAADDVCCDRWGIGPLNAWHSEGRLNFDRPAPGEAATVTFSNDPPAETASLCAGNSDKLTIGHKKSPGILKAFREVLTTAGHDVDAFEELHRDISATASASPRELVRKVRPRSGVLVTFARHSPEVGDLAGCGTVILHVLEQGSRPCGNAKNIGLVYALPPIGKVHKGLTPGTFLCALRAAGSNIARTLREYNRLAAQSAPEAWERATWLRADIRSRVECLMSDRNLKSDLVLQRKIGQAVDGWLDLEHVKGSQLEAELLDALSTSSVVETKVADDGKVFVRRVGGKKPPAPVESATRGWKRPFSAQEPGQWGARPKSNDPTCWDYVKRGICPRGPQCRYHHPGRDGPDGVPQMAPEGTPDLPPRVVGDVDIAALDANQQAKLQSQKAAHTDWLKEAEKVLLPQRVGQHERGGKHVPPPRRRQGKGQSVEPPAKVQKTDESVAEIQKKMEERKKRFSGW